MKLDPNIIITTTTIIIMLVKRPSGHFFVAGFYLQRLRQSALFEILY